MLEAVAHAIASSSSEKLCTVMTGPKKPKPAYGATMKQVWANCAACAATAGDHRGAALPIVVSAMPEPESISR